MAQATFATLMQRALPALKILTGIKDLTMVFVVIAIMAIIIVPLPSGALDLLLTISIALSVLIIMISIFIDKPTDFTTYPTLILLITLFRLSLNIATTRMILSEGHNGPTAVSDIIASFGSFVVGGNYVIGIIIFIILVLINFMVVTNGSTRVAEVAARFTLDAMPGKQMAIDADLNAGLIDDSEAKQRREEVVGEANFYGAMDGSSKFVKGDAVAGIIITLVNIIGGILIGVFQHDMTIAASAEAFTVLTIGDGLVGQIPALLVSTATGIIITRASKDGNNFAQGSVEQLGKDYNVLFIVGSIMVLFALVPGLPTLSLAFVGLCFLSAALVLKNSQDGSVAKFIYKTFPKLQEAMGEKTIEQRKAEAKAKKEEIEKNAPPKKTPEQVREEEEKTLDDILKVELLELDVGYGLIKLADESQGGDLLDRVRTMRRKIASEFGFLMPQVRIRDNLQLEPDKYEILLKGITIGGGKVDANRFLAMNSGLVIKEIDGEKTKEPAFGLDAIWIDASQKDNAIMNGYTVVDPSTVITTHLSELVKKYSEEMLTRQDVDKLVKSLEKDYPVVTKDALNVASVGLIQGTLKALLHEKIPIRDMLTIMETIADVAGITQNQDILVEQVRARLARTITSLYKNDDGVIKLLTFDTTTEQKMLDKVKEQNGQRSFLLNVTDINYLVEESSGAARAVLEKGVAPVVMIVDPNLRKPLSEIYERFSLDIVVLSHAEIDTNAQFEVLGTITLEKLV